MADPWTEAARMAGCGLAVAAVAAPVAALGWRAARRSGEPILARWRPWRVPWGGFEVVLAFLVLAVLVPSVVQQALSASTFFAHVYGPDFPTAPTRPRVEESAAVAGGAAASAAEMRLAECARLRQLWAGAVALPIQLGLLILVRRTLYADWAGPRRPSVGARLVLAVAAWAVLTPAVLVCNQVVIQLLTRFGGVPEDHPLARLTGLRSVSDQILFLFGAAVAAALIEEVLFRGILLPWLLRSGIGRVATPVVAVPLAWLTSGPTLESLTRGPVVFAAVLLVGYLVLMRVARRKRRTVGAVYTSAALFAAVHSSVWPSPVPLFALGLGLGYLAVRTRGVLVPAVVHGLFNAVSALFVLTS